MLMCVKAPLTRDVGPSWLRPLVDNIEQIPDAYRRRLPADVLAMVTAAKAVATSSSGRRNSREAAIVQAAFAAPAGAPPGASWSERREPKV